MKPITIDDPVLNMLDGTDFIHIGNMKYIGNQLMDMLSKRPQLYFKVDGTYRTIRELSALEQSYEDAGELTGEVQEALDEARREALHVFVAISEPYVEEIKAAKGYMTKIIKNWSEKRECPDTYLLAWAELEDNEEEALYQGIRSCRELEIFVTDLSTFLLDLIKNCPKSLKQYNEKHQQQS